MATLETAIPPTTTKAPPALTDAEQAKVRELIQRHGLIAACKRLDLSPQSGAKIAANIPVSRAIVSHVRARLLTL